MTPFFGTGVIKVDHDLPAAEALELGHDYFPGYYAVLRSATGTPNETAVWMVNGDFYRDHRHPEMGNIVIYALGAPLAVDMGTNYDPLLNGATHHNVVIPAKHLGRPWDKEQAQLNDCFWEAREPQPAELLAFRHSGFMGSTFANPGWRREARLLYADPAAPVIVVQDRFMVQPAEPWVLHWNVMAEGAVQTPHGEYTPATREPASQANPVIPTVGPVKPLAAGVNMFQFTGYRWGTTQQPQPSADFDVALVAAEPQEFYIGNWAHKGLAGGGEVFQRVNGRPFEERQHRLCVRGQTGFTTVILPRRKDAPAPYDTVTAQDGIIRVAGGDAEILIAPHWHAYRQGERTVLTTLTAERVEHAGIVASGGPVEITVDAAGATITAHGAPGPRALTLPGQWRAAAPLKRDGENWTFPYDGGAAVTVTLLRP